MDIKCNICGNKSIITKTDRVHSELSRLYCSCKNKECMHRFVMNLEFSHSTAPSLLKKDELLLTLLKKLPEQEIQQIIEYLTNR